MSTGPSAIDVRTILADAYAGDPLMLWLFDGIDEPQHAAAAWLGLFAERYLAGGRVDTAYVDENLAAVGLWRFPDATLSPARGLPTLAGLFAALVGRARAEAVSVALHVIADVTAQEPHAYLHFLAVGSAQQGRGLGSRILNVGLKEAAAQGLGVQLETTNPAVLPFYEKHGFSVSANVTLSEGGPQMWAMWLPPT